MHLIFRIDLSSRLFVSGTVENGDHIFRGKISDDFFDGLDEPVKSMGRLAFFVRHRPDGIIGAKQVVHRIYDKNFFHQGSLGTFSFSVLDHKDKDRGLSDLRDSRAESYA